MAAKKKRQKKKTATKKSLPAKVIICTDAGKSFSVPLGKNMQERAMHWSAVVRNSRRWRKQKRTRKKLAKDAHRDLIDLGLTAKNLKAIANSSIVEIQVPYTNEKQHWEGRVFPWEYVLTSATKKYRDDGNLTIVRHLNCATSVSAATAGENALIIEGCPGQLEDFYEFDSEYQLVRSNFKRGKKKATRLQAPTLSEIAAAAKKQTAAVVHVMGIDAHQGRTILGQSKKSTGSDGYYLCDSSDNAVVATANRLGKAVTSGPTNPQLVFFNFHNSAARLGSMAVAHGAETAIGFQAEIDDALAELFVGSFYQAWRHSDKNTLLAFRIALEQLKHNPKLSGSGVVLWSRTSFLKQALEKRKQAKSGGSSSSKLERAMADEINAAITINGEDDIERRRQLNEVIAINVKPYSKINYSVVHNFGSIFETFDLHVLTDGTLEMVEIDVVLPIGSKRFRYRTTLDINRGQDSNIADRIKLALTWEFIRTIKESVRTSVYVKVARQGIALYEDTLPITLSPTEEWIDNKTDGKWLPSFVQPRDSVVAQIVNSAEHFLFPMTDYPDASFEGYQSVDPKADDPAAVIDLQVRALWWAFIKEHQITYANPPPSYVGSVQRIRSPSSILEEKRGTCLDLALLVTACLELIGIYPVIFLLDDHAFAGYWRSEEAYDLFLDSDAVLRQGNPDTSTDSPIESAGWMIGPDAYEEIMQFVEDNHLVPLEATKMDGSSSYWEAFEEGKVNLGDEERFFALVDIRTARENDVTPLPL